MERARYLRMYDLHSLTGAVIGLLIFIVSFTGCVALFFNELKTWEDPATRINLSDNPVGIHDLYSNWVKEQAGDNKVTSGSIIFPTYTKPYYRGFVSFKDQNGKKNSRNQRWNPNTGALIPDRGAGLSAWLLNIHRHLMWPNSLGGRRVGRALVGIVGIIMMISIITGVLSHKKIIKEMFSLRYMRSIRLKWQDTHKILGIWGLPFSSMIAFTGAYLGIVVLAGPIAALLAMKGDQEALVKKIIGSPTEPAGIASTMYSLDKVAAMTEPQSGNPPKRVTIRNWADKNAEYSVYFNADEELRRYDTVMLNGATGEILQSPDEKLITPNHILNAMPTLHYATYGDIWLKILYLILGLMMTVMSAMGMMLWIERRKYGGAGENNPKKYTRFSHLFTGVMLGLPLASAAIFYHEVLYSGAEDLRLVSTGQTYFIVWLLGIIYPFIRDNDYKTTKELLLLTGMLFAGVPFINIVNSNDFFVSGLLGQATASDFADLAMSIIGLLSITTAFKVPIGRKTS